MELKSDISIFRFEPDGGGTPNEIQLKIAGTWQTISTLEDGGLEIVLENGRRFRPDISGADARLVRESDCERLVFAKVPWKECCSGDILADVWLGLDHRLYREGAFFTTAVIHGETANPPLIREFTLTESYDFTGYDQVRTRSFPRTGMYANKDMQSVEWKRFSEMGEAQLFEGNLLSLVNFYASRDSGEALCGEMFLEGANTLSSSGDLHETKSEIQWDRGRVFVKWYFQTRTHRRNRPCQWRNRWGMMIAPPARERKLPPQCIYQYIDNYQHYPDTAELQEILRSGCTLLVIHSNWRRDAKNGGIPYDPVRLVQLIEACHRHGIRVALYMRGNEREMLDNQCDWFDLYLQRDFDGLYMDYGSAMGNDSPPDEDYPGGCVNFLRHYLNLRRLRERVGYGGVLISHTGAAFSALALPLIDAYISGECERGLLMESRRAHSFYTMAAAATGTLWSAAFPEYGTLKIIPFLAAAAQAPHIPLGMQFVSSSLHHPPVPGINDQVFRPLWKLWRLFAREHDVQVFNDYNSSSIFHSDRTESGHYLMISKDRRHMLLVVASFGIQSALVTLNWDALGLKAEDFKAWRLRPNMRTPGIEEPMEDKICRCDFEEYPVNGFYFSRDNVCFEEYRQNYPALSPAGEAFLEMIRAEKSLHENFAAGKTLYLKIAIDNSFCTMLEESNYFDLYENVLELVRLDGGKTVKIGEIGREGFVEKNSTLLLPGDTSPPVALHEIDGIGPGCRLGIRSIHFGAPFYSLIDLLLSRDGKNYRRLRFLNHIEKDRAMITWHWNTGD